MNRFALIAATGFLALALTACGESSNKPTATTTTETTTTQQPAPAQQPAAPAQQPAGGNQTQNQ
ncbi:hypothetical protein DGG96_02790 [Legionella qingyii]|uniref:Uncharacterized protein n=1 Tax=Legionella qingyii TaxID=2184757 RepID=A0A317U7F0_9GAMM|nr:hypothetical protein [Legionella qingyii]PWY56389.1 hypothetical protein DGG96_06400 [Legionella qingyii]PWY57255.1 hypothetical protein DGG96_02790 [Legionella qingyii]RUR24904.1 hypothetical protein ELY20_03890 [Legionella qingyii]RUR28822.1 hypothetical protein ELY16_02090 [Legionella qingyii]